MKYRIHTWDWISRRNCHPEQARGPLGLLAMALGGASIKGVMDIVGQEGPIAIHLGK